MADGHPFSSTLNQGPITIAIPPPSLAGDAKFTLNITDIVNAAYHEAEHELFLSTYQRTSIEEMTRLLSAGELVVACLGLIGAPVGCVSVKLLGPRRGQLGTLALDSKQCGKGLGRMLVTFAENKCRSRGCTVMQLEMLISKTFHHAGKERMHAWYTRMGYKIVQVADFNEDYPNSAKFLAVPADYIIFEKSLSSFDVGSVGESPSQC